ncbi:LemA family protein [Streptococcus infantis]|uniref:LemA family protein n=1 Tax=Streptococcus infantis ATCC 700779 TaxID=889204 RepID=E8K2S9_9STRE|nr:LemA family protein [Streptococcus infantis]EFX35924.1 LemA family protein [Streptococcus infantis ATCC 700779]EIG39245.1 LemA family protein [Streptococcus infantis ATCC 700779]SUN82551.1 LemA family protein [Streptococcus infantis]
MKNKGIIYVLSILLAIILLGGCSVVGTYNGLVSEQTKVEQAQADVATALQRRSDLIGNLVESVKGQMNHETEVFTKIAEARAKIGNGSVTSKENQEAQGELSSAISRLISLTENYPELKSNQNVEQLMTELAGSENRIFVARKDYNKVATEYNQKLRSFPIVLFANMMNFKEAETFKESEEAKTAPKVDFGNSTTKE